MLPLWIIDITKKSSRQDVLLHLVRKMEHVHIHDMREIAPQANASEPSEAEQDGDKNESKTDHKTIASSSTPPDFKNTEDDEERTEDSKESKTLEEKIDEEEREKAARDAVIQGDYWYYSIFNYDTFFNGFDFSKPTEIKHEKLAVKLADFQERIVSEGKDFIMTLRKSNAKPYQPINIVVLGDVTEEFSQIMFPSIAAILRKEKGRFLTAHIHQGMSIMGMLYVPCDINSYKVEERAKFLRLMKEIEVQHSITGIRGYDHMMLYQNVQNRTECTYPMLSDEQQGEYLLQCLVHMFLACDIHHPLLSGTGSEDTFYFSMGATSLFFDMTIEDENDADKVACEIIDKFKEEGDNDKLKQELKLVEDEVYSVGQFVKDIKPESLDLEDDHRPEMKPHPIHDFFYRYLKKRYYLYRLRYFPAELLRDILKRIEENTSERLDQISAKRTEVFKEMEMAILPAITRIISKVNEHDGALPFIENKFKELEERLSKEKGKLPQAIEENFWHKIMYETNIVPEKMKGPFENYHEAYEGDVKSKNNGSGCKAMRDEALANLKGHLSKERTMLSALARCFLLGLISVMAILPILDFISPLLVDLGDVYNNALWWSWGLFLVPLLIQFVLFLFYMRKRAKLIRILKAYYTHDAYARISNRIDSETTAFYNKMIALCGEYTNRCKQIRREIHIITPRGDLPLLFPVTMFNQSLSDGQFNGQVLIPATEIEGSRIRVNYVPRFVNMLTKPNYFQLINHFKNELSMLFSDVSLVDYHSRRFNAKTGGYDFISRNELAKEKEERWEDTKKGFYDKLLKGIKNEMVPREFPTVGDKLIQYKKKIDKLTILEPMIAYAATNGEITSEADLEFADIKVNREIDDLLTNFLPIKTTRSQVSKHDELYKKYIFVTRWRGFDHFSFNRILPKEDFDKSIREMRNYKEEQKAKEEKKKKDEMLYSGKMNEVDSQTKTEETLYIPHISSLILWAVCPDDNSSEWLQLFEADHFLEALDNRNTYREKLNKND